MFETGSSGPAASPKPKTIYGPPEAQFGPIPKSAPTGTVSVYTAPGGGQDTSGGGDDTTGGQTTTTTTTAAPTFNWNNADIATILGSDPIYQQLLAFDKAASGEDLAMVNARIAKMNAYYGSDADPLSILGRVYSGYQDRNRTIANTLAGHGMFFSGETGFQSERSRLDYMRAELDAKTKLQDYIDGLQMGLAQSQRQYKFQELQASWDAVNRWLAANQPTIDPNTGLPTSSGGTDQNAIGQG